MTNSIYSVCFVVVGCCVFFFFYYFQHLYYSLPNYPLFWHSGSVLFPLLTRKNEIGISICSFRPHTGKHIFGGIIFKYHWEFAPDDFFVQTLLLWFRLVPFGFCRFFFQFQFPVLRDCLCSHFNGRKMLNRVGSPLFFYDLIDFKNVYASDRYNVHTMTLVSFLLKMTIRTTSFGFRTTKHEYGNSGTNVHIQIR